MVRFPCWFVGVGTWEGQQGAHGPKIALGTCKMAHLKARKPYFVPLSSKHDCKFYFLCDRPMKLDVEVAWKLCLQSRSNFGMKPKRQTIVFPLFLQVLSHNSDHNYFGKCLDTYLMKIHLHYMIWSTISLKKWPKSDHPDHGRHVNEFPWPFVDWWTAVSVLQRGTGKPPSHFEDSPNSLFARGPASRQKYRPQRRAVPPFNPDNCFADRKRQIQYLLYGQMWQVRGGGAPRPWCASPVARSMLMLQSFSRALKQALVCQNRSSGSKVRDWSLFTAGGR